MDVLQLWDRSSDNLQRRENIVQRVIAAFECGDGSSKSGTRHMATASTAATAAVGGIGAAKTGRAHLVYESITTQSYRKVLEDYGILFAERIVQHLSVLQASKLYPLIYYHGLAVIVCSRYGPSVGDELVRLNLVLLLKWTLALSLERYHRHILYALQMLTAFCKLKSAYKDMILDNGFVELVLGLCYRARKRTLHEKVCALIVELLSSDSYADTSLSLFQRMRGGEDALPASGALQHVSSRSVLTLLHNKHIAVKRAAVLLLLKLFETNNTIGKKCLANMDAVEGRLGAVGAGGVDWRESLLPHVARLLLFGDRAARFEAAELSALLYLDGSEGVCVGVFSLLSNLLFLGRWYPEASALLDDESLHIAGAECESQNLDGAFETLTRQRLEPAVFVLYVCNRVLKHVLAAADLAAARSFSQSNAHLQPPFPAALCELTAELALCEAGSEQVGSGASLPAPLPLEIPGPARQPIGNPFRASCQRPAAQQPSSPSPRGFLQSQVVTISLQTSRQLLCSSLRHMRRSRLHLSLLLYILKNASLDSELERLRLDLRQRRMSGQQLLRALFDNVAAVRWRADKPVDSFELFEDDEYDDYAHDDTYLSFMPHRALAHMRGLESEEDVLSRLLKVYRLNLLLGAVATLQRWLDEDEDCEGDLREALAGAGLTAVDSPGAQLDLWGTVLLAFCGPSTAGDQEEEEEAHRRRADVKGLSHQLQRDLDIKGRLADMERSIARLAAADGTAADEAEAAEALDSGGAVAASATGGHETYKILMNALLLKTGNGGGDRDRAGANLFLDENELEEVLVQMKHSLVHKEAYRFRRGSMAGKRGSMAGKRGSMTRASMQRAASVSAGGAHAQSAAGAAAAALRAGRHSTSPTLPGGPGPQSPPRRDESPEREFTESRGERLVRQIAKDSRCSRGARFADIYMDTLRDLRAASLLAPISFAAEADSDDEPSRADSSTAPGLELAAPKENATVAFDSVSTLTAPMVSPRSPKVRPHKAAQGQLALLRRQSALLDPSSPMQRAMRDLVGGQGLGPEHDL